MSNSGTLLESLVSFYGNLTLDVVNAMSATRQDIRTGDFNFDKALGRAIKIGLDSTEGWLSAILVTASHPLPTVFLAVGRGTTASATISVQVTENPKWTALFQIGGAAQIASEHVIVESSRKGDSIVVKIPGLAKLKSQIEPGLYQGLIYMGARPLAIIMLLYDSKYQQGEPDETAPAPKAPTPKKRR